MKSLLKFGLFVATLVTAVPVKSDSVVNYPTAPIYTSSEVFKLQGDGTDIDVLELYEKFDYTQFAMHDGPVEFTLQVNESITDVLISPQKLNIASVKKDKQITFKLDKPEYLIIKINDLKELVFMADSLEENVPDIADSFNVKEYNADGSNKDHITHGIQDALDAAAKKPGSTVYVPEGVYYTSNLVVPSDTELYLAPGSVVKFTGNATDYTRKYTKDALSSSNGTWFVQSAIGSQNVKITGRGVFDGTGYYSQKVSKFICNMVVPVGTKNFLYDGPLVLDPPFWAVQPTQSKGVTFKNLKIVGRQDLGQNDGIDVCGCDDTTISRSVSVSADDPYSSKTWDQDTDIAESFPYDPTPNNNILFEDCLSWTLCYGFKIGQGVLRNQTGITFRNGVVYGAGVGMGIDHKYGLDTVQDVLFENIDVEDLYGNSGGQASWLAVLIEEADDLGVGDILNLEIKDIRVRNLGTRNGTLLGYDKNSIIDNVKFTNIIMFDNTTAATSLDEMNILNVDWVYNVKIEDVGKGVGSG